MKAASDETTVNQISFTLLDQFFRWHKAHKRTHPKRDALVLLGGQPPYPPPQTASYAAIRVVPVIPPKRAYTRQRLAVRPGRIKRKSMNRRSLQ